MEQRYINSKKKEVKQEIIQRILKGDVSQFELIIRKFNERFYRIGMAFLKNSMDAEDAMQSAYLKIFENLPTFRQESTFATWASRIMVNECKMFLRNKQNSFHKQMIEIVPEHVSDLNTVEQALIDKEMKKLLEQAVLQLPDKYRVIYMLRVIEGLSMDKTADFLDISIQNVKVRLHRAKNLLKEQLLKLSQDKDLFEYHLNKCDKLTKRVMQLLEK